MDIEEIAARIEIGELLTRYCRATDDRDPEAYANVFTEDGIMHGASGYTQGRAAIKELIKNYMGRSVHVTSNSIVEVDGDRATQTCTVVTYWRTPTGVPTTIRLVARYEDELVKTEEGWRIAHRRVHYPHDTPLPEGQASF